MVVKYKNSITSSSDVIDDSFDDNNQLSTSIVADWQKRFLMTLLLMAVILGFFAVIPSVYLSFKEELYLIGVGDIVLYLSAVYLYFTKKFSYTRRAIMVSAVVYIIGLVLFVVLGPFGGGPIWLFAFPVLAGILLGYRPALIALVINTVSMVIVGGLLFVGYADWQYQTINPMEKFVVIFFNFILLNSLTTIAVVSILSALDRALRDEHSLKNSLEKQTDEIELVNTELKKEIIERKQYETELVESEAQYRLLTDNTMDLIFKMDTNLLISYANPAVERILGYTVEEFINTNMSDYFTNENLEIVMNLIKKAHDELPNIPGVKFEIDITDKFGKLVPIEVTGKFILDADGQPQAIQGVARDIRERKRNQREKERLQSQLNQAQKMEAIGQLAGGVAHDFNNLLTGIGGNVQLAMMDLNRDDNLYETMEEIHLGVQRTGDLTRQLLAFSRKQIIAPKILDLNDLAKNLKKMLVRLIGESIELETKLNSNVGNIKADPGQVEQILVNLAVNAKDAMPKGGTLLIETSPVELDSNYCEKHSYAIPGRYTMLSVTDSGTGIEAAMLDRIFEPFFTTKPKEEGTGLGLATVFGIVKQSGAHITVDSQVDKYTKFKIYFPEVDSMADKTRKKIVINDLPRGDETVLVVEDEKLVRDIAIKILKKQGYNVISAESGIAALALIKKELPIIDILMTDIVMPKMDGRELSEKIQLIYPYVKVLFTSGYTDDAIVHHGVLDEDLNFIGKPYTPATLSRKIREVLDGSQ